MLEVQRHWMREVPASGIYRIIGHKQIFLCHHGVVVHLEDSRITTVSQLDTVGVIGSLGIGISRVIGPELVISSERPVKVISLVVPAAVRIAADLVLVYYAGTAEHILCCLCHSVIVNGIIRPHTDASSLTTILSRRAGADKSIVTVDQRLSRTKSLHRIHTPVYHVPGLLSERRIVLAAACQKSCSD